MRRAFVALILVSSAAACSSRREARPPVAVVPAQEPPKPEWDVARNAQFPFEVLDVSVAEAADFFTEQTGRRMAVDDDALTLARCVRVSIEVPAPWRLEHVLDAFDLALAPSGLEVARRDDVFLIVAGPNVPESTRRRCGQK